MITTRPMALTHCFKLEVFFTLIFNGFRVIRCVSPKIAILPHFCFPWRRPWGNHAKCRMDEREFDAYKLSRSMYLSIFNSFRVIRCLNQCVSPKIAIFPHFGFPWGRPCGNHAKCRMDEREFDAYKLARCMCPSNYNRF